MEKLAIEEEEMRDREIELKLNKELELTLEKENNLKHIINKEER